MLNLEFCRTVCSLITHIRGRGRKYTVIMCKEREKERERVWNPKGYKEGDQQTAKKDSEFRIVTNLPEYFCVS